MGTRKYYTYVHRYLYAMKKKNTLVYLDSDLVERAKRENINISRLTEGALKQALEIETPRTAKEHLRRLLADVGSESSLYGETYLLPFQKESLKLTKVGPFDNFEARFSRNSINLIQGPCGSGKSTMIRSILHAFGISHRYFTDKAFSNGTITLRLIPKHNSINITGVDNSKNTTRGYQCLIADDPLERLPKDMIVPFFAELKPLGIQIMITASLLVDVSQLTNDTHIVLL
jgi:post-segregation antitoxin (ccd killing protein)